MGADTGKLVDDAGATKDHIVTDMAVTGDADVIGHDDVVADDRVVRNMSAGHDQAIIADLGQHSTAFGPRIDGDRFADGAALADHEARRLAVILEILRPMADGRERIDLRSGTDLGMPIDGHVRNQFDIVMQHDIIADNAERADLDAVTKASARTDYGSRVDAGCAHESASI